VPTLDLLDALSRDAHDPERTEALRLAVAAHVAALRATVGKGDRGLVARAEEAARRDPASAFRFDADGRATLHVDELALWAGRFETPSIAELRLRAEGLASQRSAAPRSRLSVLLGGSPATDIGALQATSPKATLFQAASQFNCLEAPEPTVVPVEEYFLDPTQGPRASISAYAATMLRHYAAPAEGGGRFVQTAGGAQIDLLSSALGRRASVDGYFTGRGHGDPEALVDALEAGFEALRIGLHDDAEVRLGHAWDGEVAEPYPRIAQAFTSTVAAGGYGGDVYLGAAFTRACRVLQRAAQLGTLLGAVATGKRRVVLTLIGGGVFGNPAELIWRAIVEAFDEVAEIAPEGLEVYVNGYNLARQIDVERVVLPDVRERDGTVSRFDAAGLVEVLR